jgi:acetolactate synthase-1/2/3 large subunit
VDSPADAAAAVTEAFAFFATGRPRPVHIEIPLDVLEEPWDGTAVAAEPPPPTTPTGVAIDAAAALLAHATRPVIIAGGGARGAATEMRALAERLGAPVISTCNGKGVLAEDHPLSVGTAIRLPAAQEFIAAADVTLVVGSELGDSDLWGGTIDTPRVIRLDIDPGQLDKNRTGQAHLLGDAAATLRLVLDALPRNPSTVGPAGETGTARAAVLRAACRSQAESEGAAWVAVNHALRRALPAGSTVAGDSSQVTYFGTAHFFEAYRPGEFLYMAGFATLGYGLPAAIGAKLADPSRAVAVLLGDGAVMFSIQEIVTAVEQRLPIPIVVLDNSGYAEIKDQQRQRDIEPIGVDLVVPDLPGARVRRGRRRRGRGAGSCGAARGPPHPDPAGLLTSVEPGPPGRTTQLGGLTWYSPSSLLTSTVTVFGAPLRVSVHSNDVPALTSWPEGQETSLTPVSPYPVGAAPVSTPVTPEVT